ncbi:hypothetical protein SAMN00017405_2284 [Desulfonispora thiosulfatigenes DSM 11270]|uniref:Probable membrane transporter protein n=1 Tax=Desulfonispora thiosulfatigenes DSM 11270 TaxID=656914 RepID=A0A1W1VDA2_DESTI|nr:sulfite exporter TauE/SafE family protein [Desulfonispora thiosulfatigenes]SMB91352.1 hypothetical protein SAMN00017405_2284 [Desulfonispora thiosulfatigenes DSM 11270]
MRIALLILIGLVTGLINGLLGIGGGSFLIPMLIFILGIEQHIAHGTSLTIILPTAFTSAVVYYLNSNLDLKLAFNVAIGAMIGAYIGAKLMNKLPSDTLRKVFSVFIIIAGLRMVI